MTIPSFIRVQKDGVQLAVKLQPRAAKTEIREAMGDELKICVTAPPVDAAANEALLRLLAERLGCPRGAVQLVRGQTSRHKTILIRGLAPEAVMQRIVAQERGR
jgi:uncharacterized protein